MMRLLRLKVVSFAGIEDAEVEFGPGLNVLYGPNDLGKSTLVAAIRLALLLPHTSTDSDEYVAWSGGHSPIVEMTFETEAQRIWRVRKQFGKSGSSLLQESRNGRDFDDVERGRKVDGRLREILRWGIREPGGAGGGKGLPISFLATALLSTQADVSALLGETLRDDPTGSGRERIAAALEAVAQDPLFAELLRKTQAQRDEAYTDKGAKKSAKGSVFKTAAERVNGAREEKEKLQKIVTDSEGAEKKVRELSAERIRRLAALAEKEEEIGTLERLAKEAADREAAMEKVLLAQEEVRRIQRIGAEVDEAERTVEDLIRKIAEAERELQAARGEQAEADSALESAEEYARGEGSGPALTGTVVRQELELRKAAVDRAENEARRKIESAMSAQEALDTAAAAEVELSAQKAGADSAREASLKAAARVKAGEDDLRYCGALERAMDVREADKRAREAQAAVDNEASLRAHLEVALVERATVARQRAEFVVPLSGTLAPMHRLHTELATARGALDVGFVVTVSPHGLQELRVRTDGVEADPESTAQPLEIEAGSEVEVAIGDVATVRVRGGRRDAQEKVGALEDRWRKEVAPHLVAAGVVDLGGLEARVAEVRELDSRVNAKETDVESLRARIGALSGSADALREASLSAESCRASLGGLPFDTLAADLTTLGENPMAALRKRQQRIAKDVDAARDAASQADTALTLTAERARSAGVAVDAARAKMDAAIAAFPQGVSTALAAAKAALGACIAEREKVAAEFASLERTIEARRKGIDEALVGARTRAEKARTAVETAQGKQTAALTVRASQDGRLIELRKSRDAENLAAAETRSSAAIESHAALPVPGRMVNNEEEAASRNVAATMRSELEAIEREIQRAHGALQQVGGAVARERLRDATEAFETAERQEREVEEEYEAWKLLLDQMKEADAAQASNLGQSLAPAIAAKFQELTQRRYETIQLTAQLATEGIVVAGAVRAMERISVGTREQLSTLYRLSLAEYLQTVIVLDDQLVQSDEIRMDWFRSMLVEKARGFQIVVFTCRPGDYLAASSIVPEGSCVHADTDGGFTRAVDLGRVLRRR